MMNRVLAGEAGAARDIVLLNAAATIYAANVADSLEAGVEAAREAIDSGRAARQTARIGGRIAAPGSGLSH